MKKLISLILILVLALTVAASLAEEPAATPLDKEAFDALLAEYNEDTGEPEQGYAICEGNTTFVESFTNGAMALENVGDVSEPVESSYGYHIIKYVAAVEEGPVDIETVKEGISSALLSTKQNDVTNQTIAQYVSEAKVKTYPERMN